MAEHADHFIHEALLYESTGENLRCGTCERRCTIGSGGLGWCQTRENCDGKLYTLTYGAISSLASNPIEKKPFYHFHPGTYALTAGSWSCNFGCPWCQNWDISKSPMQSYRQYLSPEQFIEIAESYGCQGTSISFNEPTLSLEWAMKVIRLGREHGMYNTFVTNGYMTPEALTALVKAGLDAMNVDIKGNEAIVRHYCKGVEIERVWACCSLARQLGLHLEVTTLIIPGVNDAEDVIIGIAKRIASEIGPETPWHVSGYRPAYQFNAPATPVRSLEQAWETGRWAGLDYVYVGNMAGHDCANTYCNGCGERLIHRVGYDILSNRVQEGTCAYCGKAIPGVWN